ncbi:hypothetical protein IHE61_14785 [Streptomyces sp. GKU 257-1]|nr:hypothetical protein [Streptomyces sp. GKU 257-1]
MSRSPSVAELRRLAPGAPLGQVFAAYLGLLGTEQSQAAAARQEFARFRAAADDGARTAREQAHLTAAAAWLDGNIARAGAVLREIAVAWPRDALALVVGHQIDFFTGNAAALRDRIAGALTAWDEEDPHHGPLLGMLGFGLEESGHYARAEETARAAVERHPGDVWGIHAVVHTLEMQGRFAEGIRFLDARRPEWGAGNMMAVHNWWHYALYALEAGDTRRVLEVYDAALDPAVTSGLALELLDASSLLWRFHLGGDDDRAAVGDRWAPLADAWARPRRRTALRLQRHPRRHGLPRRGAGARGRSAAGRPRGVGDASASGRHQPRHDGRDRVAGLPGAPRLHPGAVRGRRRPALPAARPVRDVRRQPCAAGRGAAHPPGGGAARPAAGPGPHPAERTPRPAPHQPLQLARPGPARRRGRPVGPGGHRTRTGRRPGGTRQEQHTGRRARGRRGRRSRR